MNKLKGYKKAVIILSVIVAAETFLLFYSWLSRPKKIPPPLPVPAPQAAVIKGKIAIVIDDWGYNLNNLHFLDEIKVPFTLSVLPNLPFSRKVAQEGHGRGREVILHLPVEPHEKFRLEQNTILTSMDEAAIRGIVNRDLDNLTFACGVSNHMGSKGTEDTRTMAIIFGELKKRHLYFLDSYVSPKSICAGLAHKMNLPFIERDVFLDNKEDHAYIREQINKLKVKAKVYGRAVGIGHDRRVTLEVLKEITPELEREGYKFVAVSDLVR